MPVSFVNPQRVFSISPSSFNPLNWSLNWERTMLIALVTVHVFAAISLFAQGSVFLATCSLVGALIELKMSKDIANLLDYQRENGKLQESNTLLRNHLEALKKENTTYAEQNTLHSVLLKNMKKTYEAIGQQISQVLTDHNQRDQETLEDLLETSEKFGAQLGALEQLKEEITGAQEGFAKEMSDFAKRFFKTDTERLEAMRIAASEMTAAAGHVAHAKKELQTLQKELETTRQALERAKQDLEEVIKRTQKASDINLATAHKAHAAVTGRSKPSLSSSLGPSSRSWLFSLFS